ncbi:MAG: adenylate kinase [Clostridia bacterium]|nr:adenylate kinase [Clostridia bacterium]
MNLILMGAPGAGKGTQSEKISEKWGIPAISTGDILRAAIKAGTALGQTAKSYIDDGKLVPDEIVIGIIKEYLTSDACKNGFILDGFPRSIPQAEALDAMGVKIDAVLSIEVADETIVQRMSGRRVCTCGASYHVLYKPSQKDGICDKCGAELYVRKDDAPETVTKRLETYHAQTEPLKAFYEAKGLLITVQGQEEVADTTRLVHEALSQFSA